MCEKKDESFRKRILEAKKYQKMAICALLPEEQREHMDVIGKEMKTVLVNGLLNVLEETGTMDRVMQYAMNYFFEEEKSNGEKTESRENPKSSSYNKGNGYTESCRQTKDNIEKEDGNKKSSVRKVVVG